MHGLNYNTTSAKEAGENAMNLLSSNICWATLALTSSRSNVTSSACSLAAIRLKQLNSAYNIHTMWWTNILCAVCIWCTIYHMDVLQFIESYNESGINNGLQTVKCIANGNILILKSLKRYQFIIVKTACFTRFGDQSGILKSMSYTKLPLGTANLTIHKD